MKKALKALLYSFLVGLLAYLIGLVLIVMIGMTGTDGIPRWVGTVFTMAMILIPLASFIFFYRRQSRTKTEA